MCRFVDLPDDVIYTLLKFCDVRTLGRLAQVCRRLSALIGRDCVWLSLRCRMTCVFGSSLADWSVTAVYSIVISVLLSVHCYTGTVDIRKHYLITLKCDFRYSATDIHYRLFLYSVAELL